MSFSLDMFLIVFRCTEVSKTRLFKWLNKFLATLHWKMHSDWMFQIQLLFLTNQSALFSIEWLVCFTEIKNSDWANQVTLTIFFTNQSPLWQHSITSSITSKLCWNKGLRLDVPNHMTFLPTQSPLLVYYVEIKHSDRMLQFMWLFLNKQSVLFLHSTSTLR